MNYQQIELMKKCLKWAHNYREDNMDYSEDYNNLPDIIEEKSTEEDRLDELKTLIDRYPKETIDFWFQSHKMSSDNTGWKITRIKNEPMSNI